MNSIFVHIRRAGLWLANTLHIPIALIVLVMAVVLGTLGGSLLRVLFPAIVQDQACSNAEWIVQEATRCAYYPNMWNRWSEIEKLYANYPSPHRSANAENCPGLIADARKFGLRSRELYAIGQWTAEHRKAVLGYWREVKGYEFCAFIRDAIN